MAAVTGGGPVAGRQSDAGGESLGSTWQAVRAMMCVVMLWMVAGVGEAAAHRLSLRHSSDEASAAGCACEAEGDGCLERRHVWGSIFRRARGV